MTGDPHRGETGQVAVVNGASGGMGRVIALELARAGAHVVAVVRTPARGEALAAGAVNMGAHFVARVTAAAAEAAATQAV